MLFRSLIFASVATTALVTFAGPALAGNLLIDGQANRGGSGGEFIVKQYDDYYIPMAAGVADAGANFNTFCIEGNRSISLGANYDYTVGPNAIGGGFSGFDASGDPVGESTAKLFYTFWTNQWSVSGLTYGLSGATRTADSMALQKAIWYLEGELTKNLAGLAGGDTLTVYGDLTGKVKDFVDYAQGSVTWADLGKGMWSGAGGVRAVNLFESGADRQSQLVVVPLPAGALMGLALLGGLAIAKRVRDRRRNLAY
jgi:hypothetical protein